MIETTQPTSEQRALSKIPVPRSPSEWVLKSNFSRTINDLVHELHTALYADEAYLRYLDATSNAQAVEGSCTADDYEAARLIRMEASKRNMERVANANLETIRRALNVVLHRYKMSRRERRNLVDGEIVDMANGE